MVVRMEADARSQAMTAAAEEMIRRRVSAIEPAAAAQSRLQELEAQVAAARGEVDRAYRAALSVGWTPGELKQLGLDAPARRQPRRKGGKPRPRPEDGQAAEVEHSDGTNR